MQSIHGVSELRNNLMKTKTTDEVSELIEEFENNVQKKQMERMS